MSRWRCGSVIPFMVALAAAVGCRPFGVASEAIADGGGTDASSDGGVGYRAAILADLPIAYWRLGESVGPVAKDETGHFDGTYQGGCGVGVPGAIPGDANTAVSFDGTCTIDVGDHFAFVGNAPYTIEAWASTAPTGTYHHLFTRELRNNGPVDGYALLLPSPLTVFAERAEGSKNHYTNAAPIPSGAVFTHLVATYDGATLRVFVDGGPQQAVGDSNAMNTVAIHAFIGSAGGSNFFEGVIDEVALYDKALAPDRIKAHYDAARH